MSIPLAKSITPAPRASFPLAKYLTSATGRCPSPLPNQSRPRRGRLSPLPNQSRPRRGRLSPSPHISHLPQADVHPPRQISHICHRQMSSPPSPFMESGLGGEVKGLWVRSKAYSCIGITIKSYLSHDVSRIKTGESISMISNEI